MNPNYLDFEQPIAELEAKIEELEQSGQESKENIDDLRRRLLEVQKKTPRAHDTILL